ncbi:MAG: response regulator [Deltaproteobacteria bacterium]|nr:response regulator [Deltaproteobacteria bacterium]
MQTKKILIVDDVKFFIELQKSFLKRTNCSILTANDGHEALKIIKAERPDLILLDLYMPEMNGDECCKLVKSDPELKQTPIIMVTKAGEEDEKAKCLLAGCDEFVTKPINRMELLGKVKNFLHVLVREHVRAPINTDVTFLTDGEEHTSAMHDISEGGMFIVCTKPLDVGSGLVLRFKLPKSETVYEAEGDVVRIIEDSSALPSHIMPGMGIKFSKIPLELKMAIANYVKEGSKGN